MLLAPAPRLLEAQASSDDPELHNRIVEAVETTLAQKFPANRHRLQVSVVRTGGDLDATAPLRVVFREAPALPRSHLQIKIQQPQGQDWQESGWAMLYVAHFDSVGVVTRRLEKDETLSPADIRFSWMETTRFHGDPLTPAVLRRLQAKGELFASRHLKAERTLRAGDVRNALDVELGQSVIMAYSRDTFLLEFTCKARMQGFVGDEIKLFAPATNKTYRARITAPGRAQWLETLD